MSWFETLRDDTSVMHNCSMARYVLVHGGWHGAWCFRWLAEELEARGHGVEAVDLPCEKVGLTPLDYAHVVGPQPDAIVVGHSLAGFTVPYIDARVRVYLAALPPLERPLINEAFVETFGGMVSDSTGRSYWPDADTAALRMYPDCTRRQSDWHSPNFAVKLVSSLFPQHLEPATSSLRLFATPRSTQAGRFARPAPMAQLCITEVSSRNVSNHDMLVPSELSRTRRDSQLDRRCRDRVAATVLGHFLVRRFAVFATTVGRRRRWGSTYSKVWSGGVEQSPVTSTSAHTSLSRWHHPLSTLGQISS